MGEKTRQYNSVPRRPPNQQKQINFDLVLQISLMREKTRQYNSVPRRPLNQQKQINFVIAFLFDKNNLDFRGVVYIPLVLLSWLI